MVGKGILEEMDLESTFESQEGRGDSDSDLEGVMERRRNKLKHSAAESEDLRDLEEVYGVRRSDRYGGMSPLTAL